jgi:hypothetical protein
MGDNGEAVGKKFRGSSFGRGVEEESIIFGRRLPLNVLLKAVWK